MEITLDQLLTSRENRCLRQQELIADYPDATLVCLTVIMPGNVKRNFFSLIVAGAALQALIAQFDGTIRHISTRDLATGFEAYLVTDIPQLEAKKITCQIEDSHMLGRLFDIDVINCTGIPMQRTEVGHAPRQCLICDKESRYCMRNHSHSQEELQAKIREMVEAYVH